MLEQLLESSENYRVKLNYSETLHLATRFMSDPPLNAFLLEYHSRMLNEAVQRNPQAIIYVKTMLRLFLDSGPFRVDLLSFEKAVQTLYQDMYGLGVIEPLVEDPEVQEINVNNYNNIWYEKKGKKQRAENLSFGSEQKLKQVIDRCLPEGEVNRVKAFAQSNYNGARVFVGIPPVAKGYYLNYRKFNVFKADEDAYLKTGTLTKDALELLKIFVAHRTNITIIGPQNTGKTTLLSFLTDYYPDSFRIGVLENPDFEAAIEKRRPEGNVFSFRADQVWGVSSLDIFKYALRFSADVLIIPEARGAEMEEVLKAQRRGNRGSMTTLHSNSPQNLVDDIALMITETGKSYNLRILKMMIAKALDIVVTMHQFKDGTRRVIRISEVDFADEEEKIVVNDLFIWEKTQLCRTTQLLRTELADNLSFQGLSRELMDSWGLTE